MTYWKSPVLIRLNIYWFFFHYFYATINSWSTAQNTLYHSFWLEAPVTEWCSRKKFRFEPLTAFSIKSQKENLQGNDYVFLYPAFVCRLSNQTTGITFWMQVLKQTKVDVTYVIFFPQGLKSKFICCLGFFASYTWKVVQLKMCFVFSVCPRARDEWDAVAAILCHQAGRKPPEGLYPSSVT